MARVAVVLAVVLLAVAVAYAVERRSRRTRAGGITRTGGVSPDHVDRDDFGETVGDWLLVVFTSRTCRGCAAVLDAALTAAESTRFVVAVREVEFARDRALHEKYAVEAVPMTLLVDAEGATRATWFGQVTATDLASAVADRG